MKTQYIILIIHSGFVEHGASDVRIETIHEGHTDSPVKMFDLESQAVDYVRRIPMRDGRMFKIEKVYIHL